MSIGATQSFSAWREEREGFNIWDSVYPYAATEIGKEKPPDLPPHPQEKYDTSL